MSEKKIVVVFGATGIQGGSVVKSILSDPKASSEFSIRAVTRDVTKPAALALKAQGAEVVSASFEDKASLVAVLKGAYATYLVTDFWSTLSRETEEMQGKNAADAAKEADIQHLIFSSVPSFNQLSGGRITGVDHFESKAAIEQHIRALKLPSTFFMPGVYMSMLPYSLIRPSSSPTPTYTLTLPFAGNTRLPLFAAEIDTGKFVKPALMQQLQGKDMIGKAIYGATDYITPVQIMDTFKECFPEKGKGSSFVQCSNEEYKIGLQFAKLPEVVVRDLSDMMEAFGTVGYYGGANLGESQNMVSDSLTSLKEYFLQADAYKGFN